jgi:uncharacterized protein YegP (UPF0339 family)
MTFEAFNRLTLFGRRWFFRILAANGEPIAQSEGYRNRADCLRTAALIINEAHTAELEVRE